MAFAQEPKITTAPQAVISLAKFLNPSTALTVVGAALTLFGLAVEIFTSASAKRRAKREAKRLQRYYYIEAAKKFLRELGYKWNEDDLTDNDLYNLQVTINETVNTNNKNILVSWFLNHGLDPSRVFIDVSPIEPERTSRMERFLIICETMKAVDYPSSQVDLIEYNDITAKLFSDFYRLVNKWVTNNDEIVSIIYRMIYWMDENLFDPYRLMPSLEDIKIIRSLRTSVPIFVPEMLGKTYIEPVTPGPTAVSGTIPQIFVPTALGPTYLEELLPEPQTVSDEASTGAKIIYLSYEEAVKQYPEIGEAVKKETPISTEKAGLSSLAILVIIGGILSLFAFGR